MRRSSRGRGNFGTNIFGLDGLGALGDPANQNVRPGGGGSALDYGMDLIDQALTAGEQYAQGGLPTQQQIVDQGAAIAGRVVTSETAGQIYGAAGNMARAAGIDLPAPSLIPGVPNWVLGFGVLATAGAFFLTRKGK